MKQYNTDINLIIQSIEFLKMELNHSNLRDREIWLKLNSCLFSQYPHQRDEQKLTTEFVGKKCSL